MNACKAGDRETIMMLGIEQPTTTNSTPAPQSQPIDSAMTREEIAFLRRVRSMRHVAISATRRVRMLVEVDELGRLEWFEVGKAEKSTKSTS